MLRTVGFVSTLCTPLLLLVAIAVAQTDPGVQGSTRGTGVALSSVLTDHNAGILALFKDGQARFQEVETVSGALDHASIRIAAVRAMRNPQSVVPEPLSIRKPR